MRALLPPVRVSAVRRPSIGFSPAPFLQSMIMPAACRNGNWGQSEFVLVADREGLRKTCLGTFFVLATLGSLGGRVRPPRAQIRLSANLSNKGSSTSPQSANKKAPTSGGFFIGGQGGIRTLE